MNKMIYINRLKRIVKGYIADKNTKIAMPKIHGSDLKINKEFYAGIVEGLIKEIDDYQIDNETQNKVDPSSEFLNYQIASYNGDRMGKVLIKEGEIYRGIYRERCDDFLELWDTGILQVLGKHGFIPETNISEFCTKEYGLILHHQKVEMSASNVWTYSMLREACIHEILINSVLKHFGFKLHDGHLNNLTFNAGKPVFTDIGSIVKNRGQADSFDREVVFTGCYRMLFLQMGNCALSRIQVFDENNNAIWIFPRTYDDNMREYRTLVRKYRNRAFGLTRKIVCKVFDGYELSPEYIKCLFSNSTFEKILPPIVELDRDTKAILDVLKDLDFSSLLLLGGTEGRPLKSFCELSQVKRATCTEFDYASAESAYQFIQENSIKANVYLYHHLYASDSNTRELLMSDVVIVNDVIDQVRVAQRYRSDSLCNAVAKVTHRYALMTYYPFKEHNPYYDDSESDVVNHMTEAFKCFFRLIDMIELGKREEKETFAVLLVGEKI